MNQIAEETETKGGAWKTPEQYAAMLEPENLKARQALLRRFKALLYPTCARTPQTFDPRHVKRISSRLVYLYVSKPTVAGEAAPKIVPRKK